MARKAEPNDRVDRCHDPNDRLRESCSQSLDAGAYGRIDTRKKYRCGLLRSAKGRWTAHDARTLEDHGVSMVRSGAWSHVGWSLNFVEHDSVKCW